MSQPSRPQAERPRRRYRVEDVQPLEDLCLLTPFIPTNALVANFTPFNQPNTQNLGTINISTGAALTTSAAAYVSVSELTPTTSFGGDIVRIEAGPGGDFGKGVYAISRGAGGNANAVNRPGVIYRVDPATGKASVFFDLNTVINQIEPGENASNDLLSPATGFRNWYDIAFDPEGYFDGKPSMFVSSVDDNDPNKNVIYRIGSDGSFLGLYVQFTEGMPGNPTRAPSSILVPPPEQQAFLRGLLMGDGSSLDNTAASSGFVGLFFDANEFRPGTDLSTATLPPGVKATSLTFGPQVGLTSTSTNTRYTSPAYDVFTDFGTPVGPDIVGQPGLSGSQGLQGDLLITDPANNGFNSLPFPSIPTNTPFAGQNAATVTIATTASGDTRGIDRLTLAGTPYRRFQDIAFDAYGFFSYGTTVTGTGGNLTVGDPVYAGSIFATDLATGLAVSVGVPAAAGTGNVAIPVQGPGVGGMFLDPANPTQLQFQFPGGNLGGRIVRIQPDGTVTTFAEGFNTSGSYFSDSFIDSSLSITFSADGTTLYAADNDGIWQFKSVMSLAGSTSGIITGLNDLRSLGIPYEGQDSAVAVVDTGVDGQTPNFRGRIATGKNIVFGGRGNDDPTNATDVANGHGTLIAGVVAQFVPQATINPVNIFTPNNAIGTPGSLTNASTSQLVFNGMGYVNDNPFVKDPIRPNKVDRVVATVFGFGTDSTFDTEGTAFRRYPQIILALKSQLSRMHHLGIAPIAAAGQLGTPIGDVAVANQGDIKGMSLPAILSEAISVTGTYPFPYTVDALTGPQDPSPGAAPRPPAPILLTGNTRDASAGSDLTLVNSNNGTVNVDGDNIMFKDKLLVASNRNATTDFAAPAIDVPTFHRTFVGDNNNWNDFTESGTSLSAGIATGSFALVASALNYWVTLAESVDGATADAYLTQPVGVRTLNFGSHGLLDLSLYANPDGVNSILQWTAVPAVDAPNTLDTVNSPTLFGNENYREYSRIDVGNAIAAIEGAVAIDYLFAHGAFDTIDGNKDGMITAQEIQTFVDNAATIGVPEQGAMARLLGGTASPKQPNNLSQAPFVTLAGEQPDNPDVLQRRFNFFDYAANGELKGVITINQLRDLAHRLLPTPDAFTINDRQRASNIGWLVSPNPRRNWADLQHILPKYAWVPKRIAQKFANMSPNRFHVGKGVLPSNQTPLYTLFDGAAARAAAAKAAAAAKVAATQSNTPSTPKPASSTSPTSTTPTNQAGTGNNGSGTSSTPDANSQAIVQAIQNLVAQNQGTASATPASSSTSKTTTSQPTKIGSPAGQTLASSDITAQQRQRAAHIAQQSDKGSGWDWITNKLFNPGEWF